MKEASDIYKWFSSWKLNLKSTIFIATNFVFFELLLGWEYAYVWHSLRTKKSDICSK